MSERRRGRGRTKITPPADLVSQTLEYPVTLVTGSASTPGLLIQIADSPLEQQALQVEDNAGAIVFTVPPAGGPKTNAKDWRAYNAAGTAYAAFVATTTIPCIELPDGTSAQGLRIWSGTGAPAVGSVGAGQARVGDYYFRRRSGTVSALLYVCTVAASGGNAGTWVQVI